MVRHLSLKPHAVAKRHLTARGNGRAAVFLKPGDCERFMERLDAALDKSRAV